MEKFCIPLFCQGQILQISIRVALETGNLNLLTSSEYFNFYLLVLKVFISIKGRFNTILLSHNFLDKLLIFLKFI